MNRNVTIIGDGLVGSSTAFTLFLSDLINNIYLIDINQEKVEGDVLDMMHGVTFVNNKNIKVGKYEDIANSKILIITAGANQKEGESRLDLLKKNIQIFDSILENVKPFVHDELIVLVVTNPVDLLSYYTYKKLNIDSRRVIGSGTVLDSARLKYLISQDTKVDAKNIHAYVVGEHGDSEVSAFSLVTIGGIKLFDYCASCQKCRCFNRYQDIHNEVKNSAYEIIRKKGATYYAIALSNKRIVEAILSDSNSILTVSTYLSNYLDGEINDIYLSFPTIINYEGVREVLTLPYDKKEREDIILSFIKLNKIKNELKI
ncbi:MAG: L-lactate dehydrogenase [Bacilli bacterium]